jgi:hypothetical protein
MFTILFLFSLIFGYKKSIRRRKLVPQRLPLATLTACVTEATKGQFVIPLSPSHLPLKAL